jgi:4-hydroxybenzoate polyprenyltransferase
VRLVLRTSMACLAVGLAASAFRVAELQISLPMLASVFFIFCVARLQNDWRDRHQDMKRGKILASSHKKIFLLCLSSCWAACCLLIVIAAFRNAASGLLLSAMALAVLLYSETRKIPWLPISLFAITSASPAFLPSTLESNAERMLPLFAAAALFIFGREILTDLRDKEFDKNYKWTIPVAYGERAAKRLAIMSIVGAFIAVVTISSLVIVGVLVAGAGLILFYRNTSPATTTNWLDGGAALVIAALVAFPPLPNLLA